MKLASFFTWDTRANGSRFCTLTDAAPEWLRDAVYEAHNGTLPNDWIYAECEAAACAIDDGSLADEDGLHEHADGRVEIYTKELFQWQADMCLTSTYSEAEERANDLGTETHDMVKAVSAIQFCAIEAIAGTILRAWVDSYHSFDMQNDD